MSLESGSAAPAAREERPEQPRHGKRGAPQAFARKLAEILATESNSIVTWNESGSVFRVVDVERFSQDVLVKHYRHSKFSSFQRQLNLYQFRKIVKGVDAGGYQHPMFHRDRPEDLCHVRRSVSGSGRYDASSAKATAKRSAAAALSQRQQGKGGEGWTASAAAAAPRARKSGAATRRVGKLRDRAVESRVPAPSVGGASNTIFSPAAAAAAVAVGGMGADHHRQAAVALSGQQQQAVAAPSAAVGDSDSGDRSPWTSGESSDSDTSIDGRAAAAAAAAAEAERWTSKTEQPAPASSDDGEEAEAEDSSSSDSDGLGGGEGGAGRHKQAAADMRRELSQGDEGGEEPLLPRAGGPAAAEIGGVGGGSVSSAGNRKSSLSFFKKTFSFMERSNSHRRGMSTSSDGVGATAHERPMPSSSSSNLGTTTATSGSGSGAPVSPLMVDTSATARAAAAGVGIGIGASGRGVRPPPVTVSGGVHRAQIDAAGNKALTSSMSPLTPKSSMEAAALAAAAATAAMPPPPRREELGLVEQLTNMVEVFDICDLLRKVSTSNSSRLDKHGGIVKPKSPHHLRNMSVDTDQGLPQSPFQGRQGQSPTGLGSLASMELVRDSSKDWDTLMAGSADVGDIGNTMVQSVAEFFSF